jgi:hypothetical protein
MAVFSLLFGHAEWPEDPPRPDPLRAIELAPKRTRSLQPVRTAPSRLDESVAPGGPARGAFVDHVLASSVHPRLGL